MIHKSIFGRLSITSKWRDLAIIAIWPLVLLVIDRSWIFTPTPSIDPWIYTGFFFNFPQHLRLFLGTYYGTRLPWIIPGYIAYHLFPPLIANYVFHLTVYYCAVVSLYYILAYSLNRRVALVMALLMGSHAGFLMAVGWDYVDGGGIAYLLLTMLLVTCAVRRPRWWLWLALAGAACAGMVFTNLFLLVFIPFVAVYYLYSNHYLCRKNVIFGGLAFGVGAIALTLVLCLINYQLSGLFLFFEPSLNMVALTPAASPEDFTWITKATWIFGPTLIVLTSIVYLIWAKIRRRTDTNRFIGFFLALFVAQYLVFVGMDLIFHTDLFKVFYYASYLLPFTFLAFGSQLANRLLRLTQIQFAVLFATIILLLTGLVSFTASATYRSNPLPAIRILSLPMPAPNYLLPSIPLIYNPPTIFTNPYSVIPSLLNNSILLFFIFSTAVFIVISISRTTAQKIVGFGVCLLICLFMVYPGTGTPIGLMLSRYGIEDDLLTVTDSFRLIQKINPDGQSRFWYGSETASLTEAYTAITSTYLWEYRLISLDFPRLAPEQKSLIPPGTRVVILSDANDAFEEALDSLHKLGLSANLIARENVSNGYVHVQLIFIQITALETF